jgi:NAD(P)-dependent dehydrogenase (short-subunit alcohol dehydrogenase family)
VKTFLVTGATQGLGLAIAKALAADPSHRVVLGVRDVARGDAVARSLGAGAEVRRIDCASLADVRRFASAGRGVVVIMAGIGAESTACTS